MQFPRRVLQATVVLLVASVCHGSATREGAVSTSHESMGKTMMPRALMSSVARRILPPQLALQFQPEWLGDHKTTNFGQHWLSCLSLSRVAAKLAESGLPRFRLKSLQFQAKKTVPRGSLIIVAFDHAAESWRSELIGMMPGGLCPLVALTALMKGVYATDEGSGVPKTHPVPPKVALGAPIICAVMTVNLLAMPSRSQPSLRDSISLGHP